MKSFELRPYQKQAQTAVLEALKKEDSVLVQAATGAGKTILFSSLVKSFLQSKKFGRVCILAHREQLVRQAKAKLVQVWPECEKNIGIACAGAKKTVDIYKPITIGTPQTLCHRAAFMPPLDMVIIDECHRLAPANQESQYRTLIESMKSKSKGMKLVGVTATPYRLGQGFIYGDSCKNRDANWFGSLCFSIGAEQLQEEGFLVPLRLFVPVEPDLSGVKTKNGDFAERELSDRMSQAIHVHSAIDAVERYARDRKHIVVFAVTIQHAEILRDAFRLAGRSAEAVHSKMKHSDRLRILAAFDNGDIDVICNVGVLTEGWDCKPVDCMVMSRPTKSPALYVQMAGRGLRTTKGKTDCIMLDLSGNWSRHGRPESPSVHIKSKETVEQPKGKKCPECSFINKQDATVCEDCGYEWPAPEKIECPKCGWQNSVRNVACCKCGHIFNEASTVELKEVCEKKKTKKGKRPKLFVEIHGSLFFHNSEYMRSNVERADDDRNNTAHFIWGE